ncbi:tetratricopeptide repeat protein, partial [Myxococcota bacterium]|nr:tetratricopeptide repeat protein [Myxococcota bacterium]
TLAGCWLPLQTGEKMQGDIRLLRQDIQGAQKGLAEQQAQLGEQMERGNEQVIRVEKTLQDLNRAARMTDADFGVKLEQLIREVQELRGAIELTEYRLKKLEAHFEGENSLDKRMSALEEQTGKIAASQPPPGPTTPSNDKEALAHAAKLAKVGNVDEARGVYRTIIKRSPNKTGITDVAHLALGDLYFKEKKVHSALPEYAKVAELFKSGSLADDAYYKIGLCSMEMGNLEDAKIFFGAIVKNYRKSSLIKNAKAKLKEINKRLKKEAAAKKKSKKKK